MRISELAKRTGVGIGMIRYYEKHGILTPAERRVEDGYRFFTETHVRELEYIKAMQGLGFTVEEMKPLKALEGRSGPETSASKRVLLKKRLDAVEQQIACLEGIRTELRKQIEQL